MNNSIMRPFITGSSIVSTIITLSYVGRANKAAGTDGIKNYELVAIAIPVLFGLFNILNVHVLKTYKNKNYSLLVGALLGLIFSMSGRFLENNLPVTLFGFTQENINYVHLVAMVTYALIFRFVVNYFN